MADTGTLRSDVNLLSGSSQSSPSAGWGSLLAPPFFGSVQVAVNSGPNTDNFATLRTDIGSSGGPSPPPFVPSDIPGLRLWLRSDMGLTQATDLATAWADQSGNGNDFASNDPSVGGVQFTASDPDFNGFPSLGGTLNAQYFQGPAPADILGAAAEAEGFMVMVPNFAAVPYSEGWGNQVGEYITFTDGDIYDDFYGTAGAGSAGRYRWSPNGTPIVEAVIYNPRSSNSEWKATVTGFSGTDYAGFSTSGTTFTPGSNPLTLVGSGNGAWPGKFAEVIVYDSVLSDADRARVDGYLNERYAVPAWTPTQLSGLQFFGTGDRLAQSSGDVSMWTDQSPQGNDATAITGLSPTYLTGAINDQPGISWDASSTQVMQTPVLSVVGNTITVYAVGFWPATNSAQVLLETQFDSSSGVSLLMGLGRAGNVAGVITDGIGGFSYDYPTDAFDFTVPNVVNEVMNIASTTDPRTSLLVNGSVLALTTGASAAADTFTDVFFNIGARVSTIGGIPTAAGTFILSALAICAGAPAPSDQANFVKWAIGRYGTP